MRILADENFPRIAILALREAGHDVVWIHDTSPGISDVEVIAQAERSERILATFDKDFGRLVFGHAQRSCRGVVLFRIAMTSPAEVAKRAVQVFASRNDWHGHFSVIEGEHIRMSRLPGK
jgi:predicted nuclease of predicted toxin-antitoxin system